MPLITTRSAASVRGLGFCQQTGPRTQPISGYELWLDSSDASTFTYSSGSVVSTWTDKSANAYAFQQTTSANAPVRNGTQNSKSTVVFDGSNDFLVSTAAASTWKFLSDGTQSTVIIAYKNTKVPTGSTDPVILLDTTGYDFYTLYAGYQGYTMRSQETYSAGGGYSPSVSTEVNTGVIPSGQSYPSYTYSTSYIAQANHNTWNVGAGLLDVNNATASSRIAGYSSQATFPNIAASSVSGSGWTTANTAAPAATLKIGSFGAGAYYPPLQGEIAEIIMYKRKLSATEVFEMRTYLKDKWNI